MTCLRLAFLTTISLAVAFSDAHGDGTIGGGESISDPHILAAEEVERLLIRPACLESTPDADTPYVIEDFPVTSNGVTLSAKLYLPLGEGPWPSVILVAGGFNETELTMVSPRFDAPRLARCGFAAVVFYKRGLGPSGGSYADATYDDFIDDVGSIARELSRHKGMDPDRIGAAGGSSGAFVACIAAARYHEISFVINKSGPVVPMEEENDYNIVNALRTRGYADSLVQQVLPLWKRHHAAWARADTTELQMVAEEIRAGRKIHDPFLLPTPYDEVFTDSGLVFLWPTFRSAARDYLSEMKTMRKKWLSIYGAEDPIVPVTSCVRNIERLMKESGNDQYSVIVLPDVDHSFINADTRRQMPVIRIVLNWLSENVKTD